MSRPARTLFPKTKRQADALGDRLKAARLRRRISAADMAARALVSRPTIRRLEAGDLTVSAAVLVRILEVLALEDDIDRIAEQDDLGHKGGAAALAAAAASRPPGPDHGRHGHELRPHRGGPGHAGPGDG